MKLKFTVKPIFIKLFPVRLFSIIFFLLAFQPLLKVSAQETEEILVIPPIQSQAQEILPEVNRPPNQTPFPQYNLGPQLVPDSSGFSEYNAPDELVTTCPNSDFSQGNWNSWTGCYGSFNSSCQTPGFNNTRHVIMPRANQTYDPWIGSPLTTVFPGELHSARLGDTAMGGHSEQLKYTVTVGANNYLFVYRWASVLESVNHSASQMPKFTIQVTDMSGNALGGTCGYYEFSAPTCAPPGPGCIVPPEWIYKQVTTPSPTKDFYWHDWTTIALDLTPFQTLGSVKIVFTTRGCYATQHRGYAYISTYCSSLLIQTALCQGATQATLTAPPGFATYLWSTGETTPSITILNPSDGLTFWCDVTSNNGCTAHITNVLHYTAIIAEFNSGTACANQPTLFTDQSTINQNQIVAWDWDFGDLTGIDHNQNPSHIFTAGGTYNVTLTVHSTEGCSNVVTHQVIVATSPTANAVSNQTVCNQGSTAAVHFTGPIGGTVFNWINSNPAIGLVASGSGDIPSFTATNLTTSPITGTITVTPTHAGCTGPTISFTITVNPTAVVTSASTANWCNGISNTYNITSSSSAPAPTYAWTRANVPGITPATGSGSGSPITETLVNATTDPIVVTYAITPSVNGCPGTPKNVQVTVNPTAVITSTSPDNSCSGVAHTYNITSSSTTPAPTYTWTRASVPGITPPTGAGAGSSITEALTNSTTDPIMVTYIITPSVNGCAGTPKNVIMTVNPVAVITSLPTANWCSNVLSTYNITSSSTAPFPNYTWTRAAVPGITPPTGAGSTPAISETLINSTTDPIVVTYVVTPNVNGCDGTSRNISITVNPTAVITSPPTANWCNNLAGVYNITSSSTAPAPTYAWSRSAVAGITPPTNSGITSLISEALVNSTTNPIVVHYTIVPTVNACDGTPFDMAVTVNPTSVINSPVTANWCNNMANTYNITSTTTTPPPTYSWTRAVVGGISNAAGAGTGNSITETLVNITTNPVVATYVVIPTVNSCDGTTHNVAVTVNPTAVITSPATANWCNNTPNTYNITSSSTTPVPSYTWSRAAVAGITNVANGGIGASITETLVNTTTDPIVVHYLITPTVNGCDGTPFDAAVTVNPTAVVTSAASENRCSNTSYTYNITSSSSAPVPVFSWTRAVVAGITNPLGSGTSDAITETLVNSTTNPIVVHYIITPIVNGCNGTPFDVSVTVNPTSVITSAATANWCNNVSNTYNITSSSTTPTPAYTWTRSAVAGITPVTGSGITAAITETLFNSTTDPIAVTYVVTPTVNGCVGTAKNVVVTVNPTAIITSAATVNWCSSVPNTYTTTSSSTVPAPTYTWTRAAVPGITPVTGAGASGTITETLVNSTTDPIAVTYVITPTVNGCTGTPKNIIITVNPIAVITSSLTENWCSSVPNTYNITSSSVTPVPSFTWSRAMVAGITPATGAGAADFITETLVNSTVNPIVVHYVIIPTVNGCIGTPFNVSVTVNPIAVITSDPAENWCNSTSNTYTIASSSTTPAPSFAWTRAAVPGITPPSNAGSGATITETLVNSTTDPVTIHYLIMPTVNGCNGTQFDAAIKVNPTAVVTSAASENRCNNTSYTYNITSNSTSPTPIYSWARAAVVGISNPAGSGTADAITETLVNTTTNPIVVHYMITPSVNGCNGTIFDDAVTVNPTAVITSASTENWCNNVSNTYNIASSSNAPTPDYAWSRAAVAGITPATNSGTGSVITETLLNSTTDPIDVHYLITPTVNGCNGTPFDVTVTVNPTAIVTSVPTANWCSNVSNTYNVTSSSTNPPPSYAWTRAAVPGITPVTGAGAGAIITETLVNSTTDPIIVTYVITPTVNSCPGTPKNVAVTVNPTAVITSASTANWANNILNTYNITSSSSTPAPTYVWSRGAVAGITPLTGAGTGPVIAETLDNSTTNPIVVHYLITPTVNGCDGPVFDLAVTVNPTSVITSPPSANWCNNTSNTYTITSSTIPTPDYTWTRAAAPGITPVTGAGIGAVITETLINSTTDPVVVTYVITPIVNGFPGTPANVAVTVNPTAVITSPITANWCNNISNTYNILSSSTTPPPAYTWTRALVVGITPATGAGSGAAITESLVNSTTDPLVVTYVITPSVNTCPGTPKNIAITVNPTAVVTSPATANWCNNVSNTYNATSSSTAPPPTYTWSRNLVPGITPFIAAGTGATITETLVNSTVNPLVVTYVITPSVNGCAGTPKNVNVTVNPTSIITSPATANWCNSLSNTYNITSSSATPVPTYAWTRASVAGITPATGAGAGAAITELLVNSTTDPIVVTYVITPTVNSCPGTPKNVNVTVNPTAVITSPATANWANNVSNTYNITSSSTVTPPTYVWSRAAVIGITPATGAGTGAVITETLVNSTTNPIIVHYLITPNVNGCDGITFDLAVTVNPTSVITSPSTANWCNNVSNSYTITSSTVPTPVFNWTRAFVAGITNTAGSGTGAIITETLVNITTDPIVVTYVITPIVNGFPGTSSNVAVTVNPTAVITSAATANWCNSIPNTYNILSSSTTPTPVYTWSRAAVPGITPLTGGGVGASIVESLVNSTTDPIVVTYVIMPTVNGCDGTPKNIAVTVNPTAVITSPVTANWCNNVPDIYNIASSSSTPVPSYTWTRAMVTGITPATGAGATAIISETLVNSTTDPVVVTYVITPTVNGCAGTPKNIAVTVNPTSVITSPATANWCNGIPNTYSILSSSTTPTPAYAWSRAAVPGITPATGAGASAAITETLLNSTTDPIVVTYVITPSVNGCNGTPKNISVTVNPTSVITSTATVNWCNNVQNTYNISSSSSAPTPTYAWTRAAMPGITPVTGAGAGASITETLFNATTDPIVITYVITPTVNSCAGTPKSINVTVNPTAVITSASTQSWCNNISNTYNITSSSSTPTPLYAWTRAAVPGITPATGTGATATITETLVNSTAAPVVVTYVITPTVNGCNGTVKNVAVTINPTPHLTSPATTPICSGATFNATLLSDVAGTDFTWTAACSPVGSVTGFTTPQLLHTTTISDVLTNSSNVVATVTYTVTPHANGCSGSPTAYSVDVNPVPIISCSAAQSICSETATTPITLNSTVTGTNFSWSAVCQVGSVNPCPVVPGTTNPIPAVTFQNVTNIQQTVTYTITSSFGGCPGTTTTHAVTVNPSATVSNWPLAQTICAGATSTQVNLTSNVVGTTFSWTATTASPISGFTAGGGSFIPPQTLLIPPGNTGFVTYHIIPYFTSGPTCAGVASDYKINVNPLPTPVISGNSLVCELQPGVTYTTPAVTGHSYLWTITGASNVANANTNTVTVTWGPYNVSPGTLIVTETIDATGCPQTTTAYNVVLQQRPIPSLTGPQTVCDAAPGNVYQTEAGMANYTWTINGGSITAGGASGSPTATVTWYTPGIQWIQVNYVNSLGCPGFPAKQIPVTVNVLPNTTIAEGAGPNCESASHTYNVVADPLCTYAWTILPAGRGIVAAGQGTNNVTIDWQTFGAATISVTGTNNTTTCVSTSTHPLTIHPKPLPSFAACFDLITTPGAKKFTLRGASPYLAGQGVFTGNRVTYNALSGDFEFDPFGASVGSYPITYTFTNNFGCINSAGPVTINVANNAFSCNGKLTDLRDGKQYNTAMIAGKCWMTQNLAYGTIIDAQSTPQTDNCVNEKFCLTSDPSCTQYGGFYQWDELMRYASTSAFQGICPAEWHIPSEAEWQVLINNVSPIGITPADALAGSFLKDPLMSPSFMALLNGIYYINNTWSFTTGSLTATMYWTSTASGTERALARGVNVFNPSVSRYNGSRGNAFSVRCVKDTP